MSRNLKPLQLQGGIGAIIFGGKDPVLFLEVKEGTRRNRDYKLVIQGYRHCVRRWWLCMQSYRMTGSGDEPPIARQESYRSHAFHGWRIPGNESISLPRKIFQPTVCDLLRLPRHTLSQYCRQWCDMSTDEVTRLLIPLHRLTLQSMPAMAACIG